MDLLEREAQQEMLQSGLDQASQAHGCIALVSGEAGVGKTTFVENFIARFRPTHPVLWGSCDLLFTPRPLGPLFDIALQKLPNLLNLLNAGANWHTVALELFKWLLDTPATTIVVFEDIHWADEATLDLLKFIGRRVSQTHTLLILTYRDDELSSQTSLLEILGSFPAESTIRIQLDPLSEQAVEVLAARANRSPKGIYLATEGNPFFVTEVLRSKDEKIPRTVRDAILTRAGHLPVAARDVLELAAIVPGLVDYKLLENILNPEPGMIDACVQGGFLIRAMNKLSFRHELVRLAIAESISFSRSKVLHRQVLINLIEHDSGGPLAVFVHHAVGADDEGMILKYAPQAALQASHHGAHREAARHYQTALSHSDILPRQEHARLLDELSFEYYLTGQIGNAIRLRQEAIQDWRQIEQPDRIGDELRWLSRLYWFQGDKRAADRFAKQAIEALEKFPPGRELAMAYSNLSQLYMLSEQNEPAIEWGTRALELAESQQDGEIVVHALTNIGTAKLLSSDESGLEALSRALIMATERGMDDHVARCYANISTSAVMHREYLTAEKYLTEGIAYTTDRDMDSYSIYLRGWMARLRFELGDWAEAIREAEEMISQSPSSAVIALPAVTTLGYVKMRQGDPEASKWLDQASDLALPTRELQRMGPVAVARAEAAWWEEDSARVLKEVSQVYELAHQAKDAWQLGMILFWIWKAGGEISKTEGDEFRSHIPLCFTEMMGGDPQAAAAEWERLGCPYERALALAEGSVEDQKVALGIFEQLGAHPAERALRARLHLEGIKGIPKGPRPGTRANPEGLTAREMEILALLVDGLSNADISAQLSISLKTVDHHVSTVLAKLNVHSRLEAAAAARQKNIFPSIK